MAALTPPFCAINTVTIENLTSDTQLLEGGYTFLPNQTLTISFAGMTEYHMSYLANAFNNANNAASPVLQITGNT
jgi:hypothetical protein